MTPRGRDDFGERVMKIETDLQYVRDKVDETHVLLQREIKENRERMDNMRKENDDRYASKNVERFVYGLIGAICLAVLAGILAMVLR